VNIDQAFAAIRSTFPTEVFHDGMQFKYASRGEVFLIERFKGERFYYWLIVGSEHRLIHTSSKSKFQSMRTVGQSFQPSPHAYD